MDAEPTDKQLVHGICPLTYNICPGPEKCAPARFSAGMVGRVGEELLGYSEPSLPVCPISAQTTAISHMAAALSIVLAGSASEEELRDELGVPSSEQVSQSEQHRRGVLKQLGLTDDQIDGPPATTKTT